MFEALPVQLFFLGLFIWAGCKGIGLPDHGPVFRSLLKAYLPKGDVHAVDPESRSKLLRAQ